MAIYNHLGDAIKFFQQTIICRRSGNFLSLNFLSTIFPDKQAKYFTGENIPIYGILYVALR